MLYRSDREVTQTVPARPGRRSGVAAIEFAFVAPLLFFLLLGIFELGRGLMATELLMAAARVGCRVGVIEGKSSSDVQNAVNDYLKSMGITGDTCTVYVNDVAISGSGSDPLTTATAGQEVDVQVTVPIKNITWMPGGMFLGTSNTLSLKGKFSMRRE